MKSVIRKQNSKFFIFIDKTQCSNETASISQTSLYLVRQSKLLLFNEKK